MGNYRFKLANMLPNCWLSKLKNTANRSKTRGPTIQNSINKNQAPTTPPTDSPASPTQPSYLTNRPSYYIPSQARAEDKLLPLPLKPITTKPKSKKDNKKSPLMNSPRLARKRVQALSKGKQRKERLKESIAVVKSSSDPQKDFRESMVEMILENNLLASKDLEDLLASYLSLNSREYHDMIVEVFKEIWNVLSTEIIL
ncbi:hypothetical protein IEQ34_002078 [Dendrobium chrysotoxum]|uniref:Transcription repressor n=1 Tax=Dendrobium chrysotoxum TaxID=161865 RepID=A0AAV7HJR7_DENCH|nr:hypothetical protein IEQ34_002078 [Dendrobium chrysotoxum]